jgi:hypothetical protein
LHAVAPSSVQEWLAQRRLRAQIRKRKQLVPAERLKRTYREAVSLLIERRKGRPLGDYLEFGVYNGTSLACMHDVLKDFGVAADVRLFGFDTFEGLPADCVDEKSPWKAGEFSSGLEFTRAVLTEMGVDWKQVFLVPGRFSDSLNDELVRRHGITRCSVIMVDCDLYASARQALDFCAPLITDDVVIVFDDWPADDAGYQGENVAFAEFLAANIHLTATPLELEYSNYSAVFLVEPRMQAKMAGTGGTDARAAHGA